MPDVVAIANGLEMVTEPVAPETVMPSPAERPVTPVFEMVSWPAAKEVEMPVPFA